MSLQKPKTGLTSEEAAALYLSDGRTKNIDEAVLIDRGQELNMDALTRAHLRRQMGFDFRIKQATNALHVYSTERPFVSTRARLRHGDTDEYGNILNQEVITRLVTACLALRTKWHDAKENSK